MPPPAMITFNDVFAQKSNDIEWQDFSIFSKQSPNPNPSFNVLVKKASTQSEKSTSSLATGDSFRMVLHPSMPPPPRDSAVPLPMLPEPMRTPKKLSHQETLQFMRKSSSYKDEDFKCNAFCLSIPKFGKHKSVRSPPKRQDSMDKKMTRASSFTHSSRASLEMFECGSWASTTALTQENGRLFFDYPVEMSKYNSRSGNGGKDMQEPVTSSFLFNREAENLALRSVLRSTRDHRRSAESSPQRRVRFSASSSSASCPTSPKTCITPRLRKARDDFNSFLSAQNI